MAFNQDQHEAHDPLLNLTTDQAQEIVDLIEDYELSDEMEDVRRELTELADGDENIILSPEKAGRLAEIIREQGDDKDHTDLMDAIDSVAKQHDVAQGGVQVVDTDDD